jgi:hypothetical protein
VITDTEDDIGIFFKLEGNDVKVSLRDFASYVKFNKECYHKGNKCGTLTHTSLPSYLQHLLQDKSGTD